jgi:hypothetical protein
MRLASNSEFPPIGVSSTYGIGCIWTGETGDANPARNSDDMNCGREFFGLVPAAQVQVYGLVIAISGRKLAEV